MNATVRVLLGDDHKIVREGLKMVLADDPLLQVVAEADTGPGVLDAVQQLQGPQGIDVVLLDIAMPGMDGLAMLRTLERCESMGRLHILVLCERDDMELARCGGLPSCAELVPMPVTAQAVAVRVGRSLLGQRVS